MVPVSYREVPALLLGVSYSSQILSDEREQTGSFLAGSRLIKNWKDQFSVFTKRQLATLNRPGELPRPAGRLRCRNLFQRLRDVTKHHSSNQRQKLDSRAWIEPPPATAVHW